MKWCEIEDSEWPSGGLEVDPLPPGRSRSGVDRSPGPRPEKKVLAREPDDLRVDIAGGAFVSTGGGGGSRGDHGGDLRVRWSAAEERPFEGHGGWAAGAWSGDEYRLGSVPAGSKAVNGHIQADRLRPI